MSKGKLKIIGVPQGQISLDAETVAIAYAIATVLRDILDDQGQKWDLGMERAFRTMRRHLEAAGMVIEVEK